MSKDYVLGIDIGGTKVAVAIVDRTGKIYHRQELPSNSDSAEELFGIVTKCINNVLAEAGLSINDIYGVGAGIPGKVDNENGIAIIQNNIPWRNFPFKQRLQDEYNKNLNIIMDNDVIVAAYAEYKTRNLEKNQLFNYFTISTGLAATSIIDNMILRGAGFSGEIGFIPIKQEDSYLSLEESAGGPAIKKAYSNAKSTKEVFDKAALSDQKAIKIIRKSAHSLAVGIYAIVCILDPHLIVLGGSVAYHNPKFVQEIIHQLSQFVNEQQSHILENISVSTLGSDNGVIGAGLMAFDKN